MSSYVPIRLRTIRQNENLGFSVFVFISHKEKYIRYINEGDEFDGDRYKKFKDKKVKKLYILSDDESKYQAFVDRKLNAAIDDDSLSNDERAEILTAVTTEALEKFKEDPESKEAFDEVDKAGRSMVEVITKRPGVLKSLLSADAEDDISVSSAMNCCTLAIRIGKLLSFEKGLLESVGSAALLRDISYKDYSEEEKKVFAKPYGEITDAEWEWYKDHPNKSVEILKKIDSENLTSQVVDIVKSHEEKNNGLGFPNKVGSLTMQSEIVSLCSHYDRYVTWQGKEPTEALQILANEDAKLYNPKYTEMLGKVLFSLGMIKV